MNVYPSIGLDGLAIGDAGVIEPARAVAAKRAVDDPPIG